MAKMIGCFFFCFVLRRREKATGGNRISGVGGKNIIGTASTFCIVVLFCCVCVGRLEVITFSLIAVSSSRGVCVVGIALNDLDGYHLNLTCLFSPRFCVVIVLLNTVVFGDILFNYGPGTQYPRVSGAKNKNVEAFRRRGGGIADILNQRNKGNHVS